MARMTMSALLAQAQATLADNTTGNISAADVRDMIEDVINSLAPGYAVVGNSSLFLPALSGTPVKVSYDQILLSTTDFQVLIPDAIQRLGGGLPFVANRITFTASVEAITNAAINFTLYRDGIALPSGITIAARGLGTPTMAAMTALNATSGPGDPTYDIRAAKAGGSPTDVTLTNVRFIVEVIPTI